MRPSILVLAAGIVSVGVACAAATVVAQDAGQDGGQPPRAEAAAGADLHRDLEVMRRLLSREGLGAGPATSLREGRLQYVYSWGFADRAVEAFHVRGDGALFLVRTSDAVAPPSGAVEEGSAPQPEATAWERIGDEVDGRVRAVRTPLRREAAYDAPKVKALTDRIVEQLGRFGDRIRGLAPEEHLTVVVSGGGASTSVIAALVSDKVSMALDKGAMPDGSVIGFDTTTGNRVDASGRTVLTIRVTASDCRRCAKGEIDLAEFRRRAVISAY